MKEIFINVDFFNSEGIKTIQGNNNAETYKICILKSKVRLSLVGKTVKLGYVMAGTTNGDILEDLNITNAAQGEITFPITNKISKKDGVYTCQLAIYGTDGFLEYTATFGLTVQANIFTKIAGEIENSKDLTYIERILEEANNISEELKSNIPVAKQLNIDLENQNRILNENIDRANGVNNTLITTTEQSKVTATDAIEKKSQLEISIVKAKDFIDGLDESQDIPGMRMELTELQNGLKSNQALEYEGSSITANDILEGRTEGMRIGGRTLKNLLGRTYSNYYSLITDIKPNTIYTVIKFNNRNRRVGIFKDNSSIAPIEEYTDRMVFSFNSGTMDDYKSLRFYQDANMGGVIEDDKNIIILEGDYTKTNNCIPNYFEGLKSFGEAEQEGDKYKISILSHGKNFFNINEFSEKINEKGELEFKADGNSRVANYMQIYTERNLNSKIIFNGYDSVGREFTTVNQEKYYIWVGLHGDKKDNKVWGEIILPKNTTCYYSAINEKGDNFVKFKDIQIEIGTSKTHYEHYKEDKKDILIKEPLRSIGDISDVMYEDNGQVKVNRLIGEKTLNGSEVGWGQMNDSRLISTMQFYIDTSSYMTSNSNLICNKFKFVRDRIIIDGIEGISKIGGNNTSIWINIKKDKLTTQDITGFKEWLKDNPITIAYQLATPTVEVVENCVDIDLDTYQEKTYFNILNLLPGTLDFKVPSNIGSLVQSNAKEINNINEFINNFILKALLEMNKDLAAIKIKNGLN